jgi:hypothetical protein
MSETEQEFERTNVKWGLALFGLFVLLVAVTVGIAYLYLALD